jgi:hypothetical protein
VTEGDTTPKRRPSALHSARILRWVVGFHLVFIGLLLVKNVQSTPLDNDFQFIRSMGSHLLDGELDAIYATDHGGFFWRFPPFVLYPAALFALIPPVPAYWIKAILEVAAVAVSLSLLSRLFPHMRHRDVAVLVVVASSPMLALLATGQNSGVILLVITSGLFLAHRGRMIRAFGIWGVLVAKPNIGLGFGALALIRRRTREIVAVAGSAAVIVITSLPILGLWDDFVEATFRSEEIRATYPAAKQITALGAINGFGMAGRFGGVLWASIALALVVLTTQVWRGDVPIDRKVAATVLLVVAANPYMSFYDAMLLVVPGFVWWGAHESYGIRQSRIIGAAIAIIWLDQHLNFSYLGFSNALLPVSMVGPAVVVWLVAEAVDARRYAPA